MPRAPTRDNARGWKAGLRLGQINQFLGNALFPQRALDHFPITPAPFQRMLQGFVSASRGKIIDEARHLIGKHEGQFRMRGLDLSLGLRFDVGVNRRRLIVNFIDGRRLGFLFRVRCV